MQGDVAEDLAAAAIKTMWEVSAWQEHASGREGAGRGWWETNGRSWAVVMVGEES